MGVGERAAAAFVVDFAPGLSTLYLMADVPERFWDDLLLYIEEGRVVPIIGWELVSVRDGERDIPLDRWLAGRLTRELVLPAPDPAEAYELNDVVSLHQRQGGQREELYPRILRILRAAALTPSEAVRTLAGIRGFDLFVSLTFDTLLTDAIGAARPELHVERIAFAPNEARDLPGVKPRDQATVFHLLGRASASPDYAICDDDLLEFVLALQDKQRQPRVLFDELRVRHLLILGCSFGDWLARFFLRTARSLELSQKRRRSEWLIGEQIARDTRLTLFLESYSTETRVLPFNAAAFVAELGKRWHAKHPVSAEGAATPKAEPLRRRVAPGAVFISYAIDDREAAQPLADGLQAAGVEVWFWSGEDPDKLGEDWARSIRRGIDECCLFLPVISRQTLSPENRRRYFWREWNHAHHRAIGMAPGEIFLVPVVVDDTRIERADLPDSFKAAQGANVASGLVTQPVAEKFRQLQRDYRTLHRVA
jgi:TIR domain/SIR2-like domain